MLIIFNLFPLFVLSLSLQSSLDLLIGQLFDAHGGQVVALSEDLVLELIPQIDPLISCILLNHHSVQCFIHLLVVWNLLLILIIEVLHYWPSSRITHHLLLSLLYSVLHLVLITETASLVRMLMQVVKSSFLYYIYINIVISYWNVNDREFSFGFLLLIWLSSSLCFLILFLLQLEFLHVLQYEYFFSQVLELFQCLEHTVLELCHIEFSLFIFISCNLLREVNNLCLYLFLLPQLSNGLVPLFIRIVCLSSFLLLF
jgi:hypothetical protein